MWSLILLGALGYADAFDKQFFHFGPNTKESEVNVFNRNINTWGKVISIWIVGFLVVVFKSYYGVIVGPWLINEVYDKRSRRLKTTKFMTYLIGFIDPLLDWINYVFLFFVTLTMQLQFILPQFLGEFLVNSIAIKAYLSNKKIQGRRLTIASPSSLPDFSTLFTFLTLLTFLVFITLSNGTSASVGTSEHLSRHPWMEDNTIYRCFLVFLSIFSILA